MGDPIDIIEVSYCADTHWKDIYDERTRSRHAGLICALSAAGWPGATAALHHHAGRPAGTMHTWLYS